MAQLYNYLFENKFTRSNLTSHDKLWEQIPIYHLHWGEEIVRPNQLSPHVLKPTRVLTCVSHFPDNNRKEEMSYSKLAGQPGVYLCSSLLHSSPCGSHSQVSSQYHTLFTFSFMNLSFSGTVISLTYIHICA